MFLQNCKKGRIIAAFRDVFLVELLENSKSVIKKAVLKGTLKYRAKNSCDLPVIGDYVLIKDGGDENLSTIVEVVDRKNVLKRKQDDNGGFQSMAANLDLIVITTSLNNDFNLKRIDRYLMIARECGAFVVLLFTKKDLIDETTLMDLQVTIDKRYPNLKKIYSGVNDLENSEFILENFAEYLQTENLWVLIGSSGVGKSTFINSMLEAPIIVTCKVRHNDKGKHTTTHREIHRTSFGVLVLDSPGIRELEGEGILVHDEFEHLKSIENDCRFSNCRHLIDPNCAFSKLISRGELDEEEVQSYLKLYNKKSMDLRKMSVNEKIELRNTWKKRAVRSRKDAKFIKNAF